MKIIMGDSAFAFSIVVVSLFLSAWVVEKILNLIIKSIHDKG